MGKVYKDDIGKEIRLNTGQDIDAATAFKIKVEKPDGTTAEWTAAQYGVTQYITYTTVEGDLDQEGKYKLQAWVQFDALSEHRGETYTLRVYDHYD